VVSNQRAADLAGCLAPDLPNAGGRAEDLSLSETPYGWRVGTNRVMLRPDGRYSRAVVVTDGWGR
jgi:hypothetical protein